LHALLPRASTDYIRVGAGKEPERQKGDVFPWAVFNNASPSLFGTGRKAISPAGFLRPVPGLCLGCLGPTARAVGYCLSPSGLS